MTWALRLLSGELAILRLAPQATIPAWVSFSSGPLVSITRTAEELSILCPFADVPLGVESIAGWRAFRIEGKLEFSAVGVLAAILQPLAEAGVNILSISTFDTDYVLVPASLMETAKAALRRHFELRE